MQWTGLVNQVVDVQFGYFAGVIFVSPVFSPRARATVQRIQLYLQPT